MGGWREEIKPFSENKRVTKQRYDVKRLLRMSRSLRAPTQEHPRFNGNPVDGWERGWWFKSME
ncbi:hypothetical protein C0Q70_06234 [Pomacea canaliculata]|uniref:Uncharacterized protein n=1 Tax=Pomacea canaliculata TaxID=400727 RepID=A0A2T7PNF3_POMCA|nr:hypothetical protein C0Q70_06234 [Pomacea canaliculata]